MDKKRDSTVFMTVHDVGSSYTSWVHWVMDISMEEVRRRYIGIWLVMEMRIFCSDLYLSMLLYLGKNWELWIDLGIGTFLP